MAGHTPQGAATSRDKTGGKAGRVLQWLLLAVVSATLVAITVVAFEFVLSPYHDLPVNGVVDGKLYTWGHLVENNRYGFREREFETPKSAEVYRVMVLGDSLTWGAGLSVEQRYTAIAEKFLSGALPQKTIEILNFGIPGGPTTVERDLLYRYKHEVEPDLIVVGFCVNDVQPRRQDYSIEREKLTNSMLGRGLDRASHFLADRGLLFTAKLLSDGFYRGAMKLGIIPDANTALGRAYDPSSQEWREFTDALRDIKRASDQMNLPAPVFAILNHGDPRNKLWSRWFHQAEDAAARAGFTTYNHESELAERLGNQSLVINKLDGHPSASVNRIYGEKLYQTIANNSQRNP